MLETWRSTVLRDRNNAAAISGLLAPAATRRAISRSRSLSSRGDRRRRPCGPAATSAPPGPGAAARPGAVSVAAPIRSARAPASRSTWPARLGSTPASRAPRSRRTQTASSSSPWRSASATSASREEVAAVGSPCSSSAATASDLHQAMNPRTPGPMRLRAAQQSLGFLGPPDTGHGLGASHGRFGLATATAGPLGVGQRLGDPGRHLRAGMPRIQAGQGARPLEVGVEAVVRLGLLLGGRPEPLHGRIASHRWTARPGAGPRRRGPAPG